MTDGRTDRQNGYCVLLERDVGLLTVKYISYDAICNNDTLHKCIMYDFCERRFA